MGPLPRVTAHAVAIRAGLTLGPASAGFDGDIAADAQERAVRTHAPARGHISVRLPGQAPASLRISSDPVSAPARDEQTFLAAARMDGLTGLAARIEHFETIPPHRAQQRVLFAEPVNRQRS
jgi:hypothetical protein